MDYLFTRIVLGYTGILFGARHFEPQRSTVILQVVSTFSTALCCSGLTRYSHSYPRWWTLGSLTERIRAFIVK